MYTTRKLLTACTTYENNYKVIGQPMGKAKFCNIRPDQKDHFEKVKIFKNNLES